MAWNLCNMGSGGSARPDGAIVTPVSNVPIWLRCAGLGYKSYTTLSQVLADDDTLYRLMSDTNAVIYLARSTSWASDITGDSSAMSYIGLNNYASDTLLSDPTWFNAIANSSYMESILNVKVPAMTNYTVPSGQVFYSNLYHSSYPVWQCFDNNTSTLGLVTKGVNAYIGYKFTAQKKIYLMKEVAHSVTSPGFVYKIQGSVDNNIYTDLSETFTAYTTAGTTTLRYLTKNLGNYLYYRVIVTTASSPDNGYGFRELQFYGRQDV